MEQSTRFIGIDVHRDTIVVAVTAPGEVGKATAYGTFPNTAAALEKLVRRLRQAGGGPMKFRYEAGPCGYGVHRTLTRLGEDCMVVAPSMIPRKSGERQKGGYVELLRQQTALARFGELALRSDDLDEILTEACRLAGEALGTDLAK